MAVATASITLAQRVSRYAAHAIGAGMVVVIAHYFRDGIWPALEASGAAASTAAGHVIHLFVGYWPYVAVSVLVASAMKSWVNQRSVGNFMRRYQRSGVFVATGVAVATPFCSCGSTAITLGLLATELPWAPLVAFMVASPLTSPQDLFLTAGLFGWGFASFFYAATIVLGLLGGLLATVLDRSGFLANQARFQSVMGDSTSTSGRATSPDAFVPFIWQRRETWTVLLSNAYLIGRRILAYFLVFSFIGYWLNAIMPTTWIPALFGSGQIYSVPLAATLGVPLYMTTQASLPFVRSMMDAGMSDGAVMAFLITGAGTSVGAVVGMLTIAKWRVVGLVVGTLWVGAIVSGFAYDWAIKLGS